MEKHSKIILITYFDEDLEQTCISHGVDINSGKNIIMENASLKYYKNLGATFDKEMGEWLLTA